MRPTPPTALGTLATRAWLPVTERDGGPPAARTVVLVHGIASWSRTWWRVGPVLADGGWRTIAVDLRGHGGSPRIEGRATAAGLADDLAATLDALAVAPVHAIVGHSLGAAVTMELVHARPDLATRVALEDPPGQTRVDDLDFQRRLAAEIDAARTRPDQEVQRLLAENPAWLPEDARQDVEGRSVADVDGILASLRADTGVRPVELAPVLGVPALYLLADEARSVLGQLRQTLIDGLPATSRAVEFDAGHTVHRDRFDDYVAALVAWLAGP